MSPNNAYIKLAKGLLLGRSIRTTNAAAKQGIGSLWARYIQEGIAKTLQHRCQPGVTIAAYTDYTSDGHLHLFPWRGCADPCRPRSRPCLPYHRTSHLWKMHHRTRSTASGRRRLVAKDLVDEASSTWGERAFVADFEVWDQGRTNPAEGTVDLALKPLS